MAKLELAKAYVQIVPSFKGLESALTGAVSEKRLKGGLGRRIGNGIVSGVKTTLKAGAAGIAALFGTAVVKGFGRLKDIENAEASLRGLGMAGSEVEKIMDNALSSVKGTAFGMNEAAGVAAQLSVAGVKAGDSMSRHLGIAADLAAQTNSSLDEMGSIYGKVAAQGKLTGDVNQQLLDRNINGYAIVAEHLGITTEAAMEMGRKGEISFEIFAEAMESKVGGAAQKMGETTQGAWANMNAALSRVGVALLEEIYPLLGPAMAKVTEWLDNLTEKIGPAIDSLIEGFTGIWDILAKGDFSGGFWGLEEDSPVIGFLFGLRDTVTTVWGELTGGITAFKGAWDAFDGDVTSSGFPGFMERVAFIVRTVWEELTEAIGTFKDSWTGVTDGVTKSGFQGIVQRIAGTVRNLWERLKELGQWAVDNKDRIAQWAIGLGTAFVTYKIGEKISGIVSTVQTLSQKFGGLSGVIRHLGGVFKATFLANPWVLAIAAAVAVVVLLWTKFEGFRDAIKTIWDAISTVIVSAWENIIQPALEALWAFIQDTLIPTVQRLWEDTIKPAFEKIGDLIERVWTNYIQPALTELADFIANDLMPVINLLWTNVVQPVFRAISDAISWAWTNVIKPVFDAIKTVIETVLKPAFELLQTVVKVVWDAIVGAIETAWTSIRGIFDVIKNVLSGDFAGAWQALKDTISGVWDSIWSKTKGIWDNHIYPYLSQVGGWFERNLLAPIQTVVDKIGDAWNGLKNFFATPINWIVDYVINGAVRSVVNTVSSALGLDWRMGKVNRISQSAGKPRGGAAKPLQAFAKGGLAAPGWALVGEEGPELVNFARPGRVYTAAETAEAFSIVRDDATPQQAGLAVSAVQSQDPNLLSKAAGAFPSQALLPMGEPSVLDRIGGTWSNLWRGTWKTVTNVAGKAVEFVRGALGKAAELALNPVKGAIRNHVPIPFVRDGFINRINDIINWVKGVDEGEGWIGGTPVRDAMAPILEELEAEQIAATASGGTPIEGLAAMLTGLSGGSSRPVAGGRLTSLFGPRWGGHHAGVDFAVPTGTPIRAWRSGVVTGAGWNTLAGRTGIGVLLAHAGGLGSYYGHMSRALVSRGARVSAGQLLGLSGNTGRSTGPHLHFEISRGGPQRPVNPLPFLHDQGGWLNPGTSLLSNQTRRPEAVLSPTESDAFVALAKAATGRQDVLPRSFTLRVGEREFTAYMDELIDNGFEREGVYA